jgi:LmbE family N-acetylglucosaminyl deacetylase
LGVARVVELGYPDSGYGASGRAESLRPFSDLPPERPAHRLAGILREEQADVLTSYDAAGGYGHPDHIQVHRVGALAAVAARTPLLLEATVDRDAIARAVRLLRTLARFTPMPELPDLGAAFTPRCAITHEVDVRPHLAAKLAALRAHLSQSESDRGLRTIALLLRLPGPLRARVLSREWFRDARGAAYAGTVDDVFAALRSGASQVDGRSSRSS